MRGFRKPLENNGVKVTWSERQTDPHPHNARKFLIPLICVHFDFFLSLPLSTPNAQRPPPSRQSPSRPLANSTKWLPLRMLPPLVIPRLSIQSRCNPSPRPLDCCRLSWSSRLGRPTSHYTPEIWCEKLRKPARSIPGFSLFPLGLKYSLQTERCCLGRWS